MAGSEPSTLWRLSDFERLRQEGLHEGGGRPTLLPTTLLADLRRLESSPANGDPLEVLAACLRHQEAALLYLGIGAQVWPVTLFPRQELYHSPRAVEDLGRSDELAGMTCLSAERPGVRPPGHHEHERVAAADRYRPLRALVWALALHGPRHALLGEIDGRAAYRLASAALRDSPPLSGALGPAAERLRGAAAPLSQIARWPGMSVERACRLLNALYLSGALMVIRSHAVAREEKSSWRDWFLRRR
jgi:hypothetical protein